MKLKATKYGIDEVGELASVEWDQQGPMRAYSVEDEIPITVVSTTPRIILVPAGGRLEIGVAE